MSASPISNVSDTARWVAVDCARESARPDVPFHDPYAQLLAGDRGVHASTSTHGWPMIARTRLMDDLAEERLPTGELITFRVGRYTGAS